MAEEYQDKMYQDIINAQQEVRNEYNSRIHIPNIHD